MFTDMVGWSMGRQSDASLGMRRLDGAWDFGRVNCSLAF